MVGLRAEQTGIVGNDKRLGRVLDALDEKRLWDKTLVIFVGDHGYHTGERGWWNKNTLFERSCRAPLVIAASGMKGGQTSRSLVEFVDLNPTIASHCGLKIPHDVAGASLLPVLNEPTASIKDAAYTLVSRGPKLYGQSVRTIRWRFTRWSDGQTELYDHERDPEESYDVSNQFPDVVNELSLKLQKIGTPQT